MQSDPTQPINMAQRTHLFLREGWRLNKETEAVAGIRYVSSSSISNVAPELLREANDVLPRRNDELTAEYMEKYLRIVEEQPNLVLVHVYFTPFGTFYGYHTKPKFA